MRILILNGPNLNLLGQREPDVYGTQTLGDLENQMRKFGQSQGLEIECYQSNHEGHLIDALHRARNRVSGVVFNPGGYCHTSVALRDAIASIKIPVVEVHISNIHNREEFRSRSLTAGVCAGQISGLGFLSYEMGVISLMRILKAQPVVPAEPVRQAERITETREERRAEERRDERHEEKAREDKAREDKAREDKAREDKLREEREEREGKRRRRGRRGGRGRRRGDQEETTKEEREAAEAAETEVNIAERYANLKGVVVRRGLDVLAEMEEEGEEEPVTQQPTGMVTFHDVSTEQIESYAASDEEDETPLAVTPGQVPAPVVVALDEAPEGEPEPEAKAGEPLPEVTETVTEAEAEPEAEAETAVETAEPETVEAEPAAAEEEGAPEEAAAEGEGEGEAEATEEGEAPKRARGARGGRRRKAPAAGGRRRGPARKKTEE